MAQMLHPSADTIPVHEDQAWAQVLARDVSASFVYAVTTTGICCHPSCPSRRPLRENVRFFPTVDAAVDAGFRACERCRPADRNRLTSRDAVLVRKLCAYLRNNLDRSVTVEELGEKTGLRASTVRRKFESVLGISPRQFQLELRASGFRDLLAGSEGEAPVSITEAVYEAGYSASSRLYTDARQKLGMTPGRFRDGGRGELVEFAVTPCSLGFVLVAATPAGICFVSLGDDPELLESDLRKHFRKARITAAVEPAAPLKSAVEDVLSRLTDHPATAELPLDLRATVFQQRVWKALAEIPRGETRSYGQIAAKLGQPTASRAVARACASNPVALLIPCHRVVGASGELTGYRWGKERKQRLLEMEKSCGPDPVSQHQSGAR